MTNDEAQAAAKEWAGEAGGKLCPQLTENELAGIVNEAVERVRNDLAPLACWWAMLEAEESLDERGPLPPDSVVLLFMGSDASAQVTARQMRAALLPHNAGVDHE